MNLPEYTRWNRILEVAQRDQARVDALTRACPREGCGAGPGAACVNLTKKLKGTIERTVWPHPIRTEYMNPLARPADYIRTVNEAEAWVQSHPYLEYYLRG